MGNFYLELRKNLDNPIYLRENMNRFNDLNDNEIKLLFDDDEIDISLKTTIAESCIERITILPFNVFITAIFYMENPFLFASNYRDRIENLSFSELLILIYDADLDASILMEITKMDVFKKNLKYEVENKIGTKLQSFELLKDLYLNDNNTIELSHIGDKIVHLLHDSSDYSEDIEILVDYYLGNVIENNQNIGLDSDINSFGITMMNHCLKHHKQLTDKLLEFYILFRIKELNLQNYGKKVVISVEADSSVFGEYYHEFGVLKIFSKNCIERFVPIIKKLKFENENAINDFLNLMTLGMISHELGHIVRHKEADEFLSSNSSYENLIDNKSVYYWYKSQLLHILLGEKKYHQFHREFIEETRADIFSIFDSNIQIVKYFKDSFSEIQLQNLCAHNASTIIEFYTQKDDNNENTMLTPMQKFDRFSSSYLPDEKNLSNFGNEPMSGSIMDNLLLGDHIPRYVLEEFSKIANKEIRTTNLHTYVETLSIIDKIPSSNLGEKKMEGNVK